MGYALASEAQARGAEVTLISGPTLLAPPPDASLVLVTTADEMFRAALNQAPGVDLVLKAAAVADYRPEERARGKIKKEWLRRKIELPLMSKESMAARIFDLAERLLRDGSVGQPRRRPADIRSVEA